MSTSSTSAPNGPDSGRSPAGTGVPGPNATRRAFLSRLYQAGALDRCSFEWLYLPPRGDIRWDYQRRPLRDLAAVAAFLKAGEMEQGAPLMVRRGLKVLAIDCMIARMMEGTATSAGLHAHTLEDGAAGQRTSFAELLAWWGAGPATSGRPGRIRPGA